MTTLPIDSLKHLFSDEMRNQQVLAEDISESGTSTFLNHIFSELILWAN